jgi:hypothetical protein
MSKTFKVTLASLFAFAFALTAQASAPATNFASSMTLGSTGTQVKELQMFLNSCPDTALAVSAGAAGSAGFETMTFGPATKAAVMKYQTKVGASPVAGYFGSITRAKAAELGNVCGGTTTGGTTTTLPAGCTSTVGFSPTTGVSCSTGTTTTTMTGTEGYLSNITKLGAYNGTKVMEGDKDKVVIGLEVLAKDADQQIDGLTVAFKNAGTGSAKFMRYASDVTVWLDGKEIGRKAVSAFSSDSSDVYTYRFTGMTGVVKKDMKGQILVSVSGAPLMDTADATGEAWDVDFGTTVGTSTYYISALSANGRYRDYGDNLALSDVDFQKAGTASSDQKFKVTTSATNPLAQTVQVSNTSDTSDVLLAAFDAKAENAAMKVQKVPVVINVTGVDGVISDTSVFKNLKLYANGTLLATESVIVDNGITETVTFGLNTKLNYGISSNQTVKFEVKADINDIENSGVASSDFDNGDKAKVSVDSATMIVELDNASQDTVSNKSGSVTGNDMTFMSTGVQVTMGTMTSSATANNLGEILSRTITLPVTVKALDETVYLDDVAENAATPSGTQSFAFTFEDSTGATKVIANSVVLQSNASTEGNGYRLDAGTEKTFTFTIIANGTTGHAQKLYRIQLNDVKTYSDAALTAGATVQDLTPVSSFETNSFSLNLN